MRDLSTQWDRKNESILCQRDWDLVGLCHTEIRNKLPPFSLIASCNKSGKHEAISAYRLSIFFNPVVQVSDVWVFPALNYLWKCSFVPNCTSEVFFSLFCFLSHWILIAQSSVIFTKVLFILKTGSKFKKK